MGSISFPNLGISVNPSRVAFHLFGKDIYWYGVLIGLGFLLAVAYVLYRAPKMGLTEDNILDVLFIAVPLGVIGARAYYCIFYWETYASNPISVLYIWEGGLAIYGGVIGGVLGALLYCKWKKIPFAPMLDVAGIGFPIGQCLGRWGNFINREAHGGITDSFLKMGLENAAGQVTYYHPTFLYESAWNFVGIIILHCYFDRRKFDGELFCIYLAWYGLGRVWIEGLRTDSLYFFGTGLRVSQVLAAVSCLAALSVIAYVRCVKKPDRSQLYGNRNQK